MPRRMFSRAVGHAFVAATVLCCADQPGASRAGQSVPERLAGLETQAMQEMLTREYPDSVFMRVDTSQVVPGLRYIRVVFRPVEVRDANVVHPVIEWQGRAETLESPAAWTKVVAPSGWRPASEREARLACEEIVAYAVPSKGFTWPALIYNDSTDLFNTRETMLVEPERSRVGVRVTPPQATQRADRGWTVRLWTLFTEGTTEFECLTPGPGGSINFTVTPIDSVS